MFFLQFLSLAAFSHSFFLTPLWVSSWIGGHQAASCQDSWFYPRKETIPRLQNWKVFLGETHIQMDKKRETYRLKRLIYPKNWLNSKWRWVKSHLKLYTYVQSFGADHPITKHVHSQCLHTKNFWDFMSKAFICNTIVAIQL